MRATTKTKAAVLSVVLIGLFGAKLPANEMESIRDPIVNGLETNASPEVGLLVGLHNGGSCTATVIGCSTVLTAAHCICGDLPLAQCIQKQDLTNPSNYLLFLQAHGAAFVSQISLHPGYVPFSGNDLAVLRLADPIPGLQPALINEIARPSAGSLGVVTGYGRTGGDPNLNKDSGLKRTGLVKTTNCSGALETNSVCWDFSPPMGAPGKDSSTCQGDSGGPLFTSVNGKTVLAGVTSFGTNQTCLPPITVVDSDVFVARNWIKSQTTEPLGLVCDGGLPPAGSPEAPILGASLTYTQPNQVAELTVEVPPNAKGLMSTLNGTFSGDVDLWVRHEATPTETQFDCASEGPFSLEECFIPNPAPGTWHLLYRSILGGGAFQTNVTVYKGASAGGGATEPCVPSDTALCLEGGRFEVTATFQTSGKVGIAKSKLLTSNTGYFYFFNQNNVEMVIKVLNGCPINDGYWVYASGLTDQGVTLRVRDSKTGLIKTYTNPLGRPFVLIADTSAFPTCGA